LSRTIINVPFFHMKKEKVICNSWYWLWTSTGEKYKKCSMNYNCPFMEGVYVVCGMNHSPEETKNES
jgi:hypothetical protein